MVWHYKWLFDESAEHAKGQFFMSIYPVIMCGGAGTRLWPTSRPSRPKQFMPLVGSDSLFLETAKRVCEIPGFKKLIVVAGEKHGGYIARELANLCEAVVLLEPEGRDSAPAIAVATQYLKQIDEDAIAAVVASDHFIPDRAAFGEAIAKSAVAAKNGRIVTMGIVPTEPTSAYGYINGRADMEDANGVRPVAAFVEKPDQETAKRYISEGYLWNSGHFVCAAKTMHTELESGVPGMIATVSQALAQAHIDETGIHLADAFREAEKISIDYAVMEKTKLASVLPASLSWSDLGAWDSVYAVSQKDAQDNAQFGDVVSIEAKNNYIRADQNMTVATIGVRDLAVIAEKDSVLVCALDKAQSVKSVVEELKRQNSPKTDISIDDRPETLVNLKDYYQKWLFTKALPIWWSLGGDHQGWGFHESLNQNAIPTGADRRARVQARQIYVYACAGAMGWHGPWRSAVTHGFSGLSEYYQHQDGLINTLADVSGKTLNQTTLLYDQAFSILVRAKSKDIYPSAQSDALAILDQIEVQLSLPQGGYRETSGPAYQSNPHMHLFEAALGWLDVGGEQRWYDLAQQIVELVETRFIDREGGFLREFFTQDWSPASGAEGEVVEPGHQFEWAWLLARWAVIAKQPKIIEIAKKLYHCGEHGIDRSRNVAVDTMNSKLEMVTDRARLWPQTERMKAALLLSQLTEGEEHAAFRLEALNAAISLKRYLDTPVDGLWWDKLSVDDTFDNEAASGSSFYHIMAAIEQLIDSV